MAIPDFSPDLSTVTSVLLSDGWHHIRPGTLEVSEEGDDIEIARFLATPLGTYPSRWIVCAARQIEALAITAEEDD